MRSASTMGGLCNCPQSLEITERLTPTWRIAAARAEAVMPARPVAVWTRASGYGFEQRFDGQWRAHPDAAFKARNLDNGTRIAGAAQKRIAFDATGQPSSPAEIDLINGDGRSRISVSASGEVAVAR